MASLCEMFRRRAKIDDRIVTAVSPIHIGLIKFFEHPSATIHYPIHDIVVLTLDPSIPGTKTSACAHADFTHDEFWFNRKKCTSRFVFALNEIKYRAATQRSVSIEFLKRKVRVACEHPYLPAYGSSAFASAYTSIMAALCGLYKVKPESIKNDAPYPELTNFHGGGFVQKRDVISTKVNSNVIARGNHWPELRVLILVVKDDYPQEHVAQLEIMTVTGEMYRYYRQCFSANAKKLIAAIKEKDFETFVKTITEDNDHFHNPNVDSIQVRDYKTPVSYLIEEHVEIYNGIYNETRVGCSFDTGPNPTLYFLEENAQEVISFIKYMFPSTKTIQIIGLEEPPYLGDDHFARFNLEPLDSEDRFDGIYTKISDRSIEYLTDAEDHLMNERGQIILPDSEFSLAFRYEEIVPFPRFNNHLKITAGSYHIIS